MSQLTDEAAATAIRAHHVELADGIRRRIEALLGDVRMGGSADAARTDVLAYLDRELLPHARAEEEALYPAGDRGATALLVRGMRDEHVAIVAHVDRLRAAGTGVDAAAIASAILALFEVHLSKENDLLIPALVADPDTHVAELLEGMHELVG